MIRWIGLLLIALVLVGPVCAQATKTAESEEDIKKEVLMVEEEQDQAVAKSDIQTLERIWADNLVYTAPNGELLTKAQHLAEFKSGIRKFESMKHDDFNVRVYGKTVVVLTGRSTSMLRYNGEVSEGPRRFTNLFVKKDGRWQLVSHHVTNVAK
jgi:ketosteroid isomerase-like protein